ncbi:MAG: hypothetical protein U0X20_14510 [Caldilineaceae bacterium]
MNQFFNIFIQFDGYAFLVMGLIVLAIPSPQPGLTKPVSAEDLPPFSQTRRLLAAMFIASALLLIVIGRNIVDREVLQQVGIVRIASFVLVIVLNIIQLWSKRWKTAPLVVLISIFALFSAGYLFFITGL